MDASSSSEMSKSRRTSKKRSVRLSRRTQSLVLGTLLVLLQTHAAWASSRSSPLKDSHRPRRKKRKRRSTVNEPHDWSSSSPSFLPVLFSDDEKEEDILSALARMEQDDDDKDQVQEQPVQAMKKKRLVKKIDEQEATPTREEYKEKVERQGEEDGEQEGSQTDSSNVVPAVKETPASPVKESVTSPIVPRPLTALETMSRTPPRPDLTQATSERQQPYHVPRQAWPRPAPLQQRPPPPAISSPDRANTFSGTAAQPPAYQFPNSNASPPAPSRHHPASDASSLSTTRWVRKFLSSRPRDTLLPIPREYLSDGFNLVQLAPIVERIASENGYVEQNSSHYPLFKAALRLILQHDQEPHTVVAPSVQRAAEILYTLVHARYVISPRGLDTVRRALRRSDKSVEPVFGRCARVSCRGMPLLPYGDSEHYDPRQSVTTRAKRYCPCCGEVSAVCFYRFSILNYECDC